MQELLSIAHVPSSMVPLTSGWKTPWLATLLLVTAGLLSGCLGNGDLVAPEGSEKVVAPPQFTEIYYCCLYQATTPITFVDDTLPNKFKLPIPLEENLTGYIFELTWIADNPLQDQMILQIVDDEWGDLDPSSLPGTKEPFQSAAGPSPLRIAVSVEEFVDPPYYLEVRSYGEPIGIGYHHDFTLGIAAFLETPYDPDWTKF